MTPVPLRTPVEIFGTPHSNFVRAVRMVLAEKALAYDYLPVRPHSREAHAVHPLGLVPGLRHGDVVLGESQAIVAYLDGLSLDSPMGPSGPNAEAAEIAQWISIVATTVDQTLIRRGHCHVDTDGGSRAIRASWVRFGIPFIAVTGFPPRS
jgi:glutathione S-transferase